MTKQALSYWRHLQCRSPLRARFSALRCLTSFCESEYLQCRSSSRTRFAQLFRGTGKIELTPSMSLILADEIRPRELEIVQRRWSPSMSLVLMDEIRRTGARRPLSRTRAFNVARPLGRDSPGSTAWSEPASIPSFNVAHPLGRDSPGAAACRARSPGSFNVAHPLGRDSPLDSYPAEFPVFFWVFPRTSLSALIRPDHHRAITAK